MKITKIKAQNLQGWTGEETLADLTFFVGGNWKGKTTRLNAIVLALLGYHPKRPRTAAGTFALSSGREMSVELTFDNGLVVSRKWVSKGNSIQSVSSIPKEFESADTIACMLDSDTYFALSPTKRVEYIFANCAIEGEHSRDSIVAKVDAAVSKLGFDQVVLGETLAEMDFYVDKREPSNIQHWLESSIEAAAEVGKRAKEHAGQMEKTTQGLAHLKTAEASRGEDATAAAAQLATIDRELGELIAKKSEQESAYESVANAKTRRRTINLELQGFESRRERLVYIRNEHDAINVSIKVLGEPITEEAMQALRDAENDAKLAVDNARTLWTQENNTVRAAERDLSEIDGKTECSYCGATGDGWKALRAAELATKIDAAKAKCAELAQVGETAKARLLAGAAVLATAKQRSGNLGELSRRRDAVLREIGQIEAGLGRAGALTEERDRLPAENNELEAAIQALRSAINVKRATKEEVLDKVRAAERRAQDIKRLAEAETARDKAKVAQAVAAAVVDELRAVQAEMVAGTFKPLLSVANAFFRGVLPFEIAYSNGEIGAWAEGGIWRTHGVLSGVEQFLVYAAIQAALSVRSPVRVMILDEMLRAGWPEPFDGIVEAIKEAARLGGLDNFVGCIPLDANNPTSAAEKYGYLENDSCKVVAVG